MTRATSRKKRGPDAGAAQGEALEIQLSRVIEREGATISFAPNFFIEKKRRRKGQGVLRTEPVAQEAIVFVQPTERRDDTIRRLDTELIHQVASKARRRRAQRVEVRFRTHAPSQHLIEMQPTVRKMPAYEPREYPFESVEDWTAPYEIPPTIDHLSALASDLFVDGLDPRFFIEQFTPAHPDVAFAERYGWWSRVRAPFIRWEIVTVEPRINQHESQDEEQEEMELLPQEQVALNAEAEADPEEVEETWEVPLVQPRLNKLRVLVGFLGLLAAVTLPAASVSFSRSLFASVAEVKAGSEAALSEVRTAMETQGAEQSQALLQASERFAQADHALTNVNALALAAAQLIPQTRETYQSARGLLLAGQRAADAARLLSQGFARALEQSPRYPDERLLTFLTYMESAQAPLDEAADAVARVSIERVPASVRTQVEQLTSALTESRRAMRDMKAVAELLLNVVGHDRARRYLVLFQNQTELRPTGGFIGSVADVTVDRGEVKKVVVPGGGPYDLRNQLLVRVKPPQPLQLIAARWEFQDSNWFPDFAAAAEKVRWFWSKSGQPSVDGVIAMNATLVQKLLVITGPIEMPEYGKTITAENFLFETQKAVELEYDKEENKPKKFIGDLLPKVLDRIKQGSQDDWLKYAALMSEALDTKEIQVAFVDEDEQQLIDQWGWSGRLKPTAGDALALVESNIAGQKTDGVIQEQVVHQATIQADGSIIDEVKVTRTHHGRKGELFSGVNNVTYARLYVPQGSELLSAKGFMPPSPALFKQSLAEDPEDADVQAQTVNPRSGPNDVLVTDEFGRTAFGGWWQLEPGATSVTTYRYRLPFTVFDLARQASEDGHVSENRAAYTLLLTSQSGKIDRQLDTSVQVPSGWQAVWSSSSTTFSGLWDRDRVAAHVFDTSHVEPPLTP